MFKYFTSNRAKKAPAGVEANEVKEQEDSKAEDQASKDLQNSKENQLEQSKENKAESSEHSNPHGDESTKAEELENNSSENSETNDTEWSKLAKSQNLVLKDEDEKFLEKITSEDQAAPPIVQPTIIMDDGRKLEGEEALKALKERAEAQKSRDGTEETKSANKLKSANRRKAPDFPSQADAEAATMGGTQLDISSANEGQDRPADEKKKATNYWAYMPSMPNMSNMPAIPAMPNMQLPSMPSNTLFQDRSRERMANSLQSAAEAFKAGEGVPLNPDGTINQEEATKQQAHDLSNVLSHLNLSAINNRVFSLSPESQELLEKFNVVLKDLINGGPTAYHDLEKLLDERSKQLNQMWRQLPPFVQTLVKSLPAKIGSSFGPELFAAAAEKPDAKMNASVSSAGASSSEIKIPGDKKKVKKTKMPTMKNLVTEKGAVAQMLRSILNFLQARFPAFMTGTNILMSLAVFILLFVFWYCHKRGRETRLASESLENSTASLDPEKGSSSDDDGGDPEVTNAEEGEGIPAGAAVDGAEDPAQEAQIDAAVAAAKQEAPTEADKDMQAVLEQPDPKEVGLPESPGETRTATADWGAASATTAAESGESK